MPASTAEETTESFDPWRSEQPLIVYLDIKSPYAFIARDPTLAMADELGIEIDWRPLTLNIPSYLGSARLDATGKVASAERTPEQWARVRYAYRDARRYATELGYRLRGTEKIWDTSLVHIAFWWARCQGAAVLRSFLDHVYPRFWVRDFDAEDPGTVSAALALAGADTDGFAEYAAGSGRAFHDASQEAIFAAGIFGVPGYVIEGEYYFGREHLPTVRWMLTGRQGPQPDVANPGPAAGGTWP
jgi:2-hydroxychromene-2-carboxylate isomerase